MSPATDHGFSDNRKGERMRSLFAIGKLIHDGRQHVCRVRNISDGGVGIQLDRPPLPDSRVVVSMRGLPPTEAEVRWVDGQNAGLAFRRPISTMHIGDDTGLTPRSPRFELDRLARLRTLDRTITASVRDISLGGMKLLTETDVPVGTLADITLEGDTEPLRGRACWSSNASVGMQFLAPLPLNRLVAILL